MQNNEHRNPLICMIILNWNGLEITRECLLSVRRMRYSNLRIIVVDNASSDNSVELLSREFSEVEFLELNKNYGFSRANNIGIEYAEKEYRPVYYLLLNNDTIVDGEFLNEMVRTAESSPQVAAVVPKIYFYDDPDTIYYAGGYLNRISGLGEHYGWRKKDSVQYCERRFISFLNFCAPLIKSDVFRKIGYLDNQFFAIIEDVDFSIRIKNSNYRVIFEPNAKIWHRVGATGKKNRGEWFRVYLTTRNLILLQKKHANIALFALFITYFSIRWVLYMELKHMIKRDWKSCKAIIVGIEDGFSGELRFVN